uniref:Uncharacterized protein n=1 Tax=Arundo donax TaxID=35708 RepID=A0A0A9DGV1_ARUDO
MAQIELEAALEISDKWLITDASLLRWRKKSKRAVQECDGTVHKCKQRIIEDEQTKKEVRKSSFPKRIAHTTKSFVFSIFSHNNDESSRSVVQRFEWFADGASEFMRFVELGGTPRRQMPFDPLIRNLFTGKKLYHKVIRANKCPLFVLWAPFITAGHGIEARLIFMQKDGNVPEDDFYLSVMLQLSESTDIVGIVIKCLELFAPLFKSTVETIRKELMQLPIQDFSWVPYVDSHNKEHWDILHGFGTQWFRPNPLCCKQRDQHKFCHGSKLDKSGVPDVSLEPVIEVHLHCQVSLSEYNKQRTSLPECKNSPYLKAGLLFTPHGSSEDMLPADISSAVVAVDDEEQHCLHTDITLEQLEEIMLPKAINYFHQNTKGTVYQILWKSKHGTAYINAEKASVIMPRTRRMFPGAKERKLLQRQESWAHVISNFLNIWATHAPVCPSWLDHGLGSERKGKPVCSTTATVEFLDHSHALIWR